jgi:hypothetical protein
MVLQHISLNSNRYNQKSPLRDILRHLSSMYFLALPQIKIKGLGRFSINLNDIDSKEQIFLLFGVCHIEIAFNYKDFEKGNLNKQRRIILDTLHKYLIKTATQYGWDTSAYEGTYERILKSNYTYSVVFEPVTFSKNRKHKAGIEVEQSERGATIAIVFFDQRNNLIRRVIAVQVEHYEYTSYLGKRGWIDNDRYGFVTPYSVHYVASINSDHIIKEQSMINLDVIMKHAYSLQRHKIWEQSKK